GLHSSCPPRDPHPPDVASTPALARVGDPPEPAAPAETPASPAHQQLLPLEYLPAAAHQAGEYFAHNGSDTV
ncbi:hypothetical protein, partial [Neokomagataea anthophila]|nr:hypothetical protein [Neokomagataea anthophila]